MIDGVSANTTAAPATSGFADLGGDVFLQLLVAQLRYQNPMEPADATSMLQQTSQFTMVEKLHEIAAMQQQLINMSELSAALDMVGRSVQAIGSDGQLITAVVNGMRFSPEGVILEVDGVDVPMANVISVNDASAGGSEGTNDGGGEPPA